MNKPILTLVSALLAASAAVAVQTPPSNPDWPAVGTFDKKGRYTPRPAQAKFQKLHGQAPIPRYPIALVHGQGGFDRLHIGPLYGDYFNGTGKVFKKAGIRFITPKTPPFGKTAERAAILKEQLLATGWEKMNLICHSMGGLDARYLVTHLGMADRIASITTVGTPHHGSWYADWVIEWVFEKQRFWAVWDLLGIPRDSIPQLTVKYMENTFNPATPNMPQVRYFSFGGNQGLVGTILPFKGAKIIMQILEKRAVEKKLSLLEKAEAFALLPGDLRKRIEDTPERIRVDFGTDAKWVPPEVAGQNDCQVSVASAMWGEYMGTLDADHFDQPGWFGSFNAPRFYRGIAQMLADAGY